MTTQHELTSTKTSSDSKATKEELAFREWLIEAQDAGLITHWHEQFPTFPLVDKKTLPVKIQLKTKSKTVERHFLLPLTYTSDFSFTLTERGKEILLPAFGKTKMLIASGSPNAHFGGDVYVDIKGAFVVQDSRAALFSVMQKLVYDKAGIYVEKVIPWKRSKGDKPAGGIFYETWAPEAIRWMKNRREPTETVIGRYCRTVDEFLLARKATR